MSRLFCLFLLFVIAACATPREQCIRDGSTTLRALETRAAEIAANIDRGYAIHVQNQPYRVFRQCKNSAGQFYPCWDTRFRRVETPVALDITEERRKLAAIHRQIPAARKAAEANRATCIAQFPE